MDPTLPRHAPVLTQITQSSATIATQRSFPDVEIRHPSTATANLAKHGVPFHYATRIILDPRHVELAASRPEDGETRAKLVGAIEGRIFAPVITRRGGLIRLISARRPNAPETRAYGPL